MKTPIADFVKKYAESGTSRFHMPGHKGRSVLGCEALDITEISGADVLYGADGIIAESESYASALFGSGHSFYSTEGSTLAIKAMLALIKKRSQGERTTVLAARNVHKAFVYACALLDIDAEWIYPEQFTHLCSCEVTPNTLETKLNAMTSLPDAVYVTSPDYLGNIADIARLSDVCHAYGIPLLVDNAHGAYLAFIEPSLHPLALGADMCSDSAHKTLPVLTGGAYLHVSKSYPADKDEIRAALALFASTSPSYLILQSLDLCNEYLAGEYCTELKECIKRFDSIKKALADRSVAVEQSEPLKLVLTKSKCSYSGFELADILREAFIEPEFYDADALVLMATPSLTPTDFDRLEKALLSLEPKSTASTEPPLPSVPERALSIREAVFSASETVATSDSVGRICASPTVSCPPAVPIVMSGEIIDKRSAELMLYYGIEKISVIN
ncbi:MAG: aminotransferase class V-fold PLP-dependent enzyme [Ruminococcaceae bacterium]|nr:aminotransferase class V-fold PLP-dependent enzyme [Oscillospiraceae bacterium]